jgi:hypothetical protein
MRTVWPSRSSVIMVMSWDAKGCVLKKGSLKKGGRLRRPKARWRQAAIRSTMSSCSSFTWSMAAAEGGARVAPGDGVQDGAVLADGRGHAPGLEGDVAAVHAQALAQHARLVGQVVRVGGLVQRVVEVLVHVVEARVVAAQHAAPARVHAAPMRAAAPWRGARHGLAHRPSSTDITWNISISVGTEMRATHTPLGGRASRPGRCRPAPSAPRAPACGRS